MVFPRAWLVLVALLVMGQQQEARGTKEMGPKTRLPDDSLFQDPAAFCEGCYGMVHEADKLLTKWQKEKGSVEEHIDAALLATCSTDRLRAYVLSPPKMMRLCSGIRAHYEDQLGMAFLQHYTKAKIPSVDKLFEDICRRAIPACPRGVRPMTLARKIIVKESVPTGVVPRDWRCEAMIPVYKEKMESAAAEKEAKENKEGKKAKQEKDKSDSKKKTKKDEL